MLVFNIPLYLEGEGAVSAKTVAVAASSIVLKYNPIHVCSPWWHSRSQWILWSFTAQAHEVSVKEGYNFNRLAYSDKFHLAKGRFFG